MRSLIAALLLCVIGFSGQAEARSAHSHHVHHHAVRVAKVSQPDFSYPVDDRYSYMNKGEWVYHEVGPKARFDWQKHSRAQQTQTVAYASSPSVGYSASRPSNCYGIPWCGCWLKTVLGNALSAADKALNLNRAIEWAHVGQATSPHVGAIVVWSHHVGTITGQASNGEWIITSGNDGHAVRSRPRSLAGVVAIRSV